MRSLTTTAINDAVYETLDEEIKYDDLVTISKDDKGNITALSANPLKINKIARDAASVSQENLHNMSKKGIPVPLGALTGIETLAGFGPGIKLRILPVSNVICNFSSNFQNIGINQTKHSIYLNIIADINIILPSNSKSIDVRSDILISENIILGKIPETYLQSDIFGKHLPLVPNKS